MRPARWIVLACVFAVPALAPAEHGVVYTNAGQSIEGEIVEESDQVNIYNKGILTKVQRDDIKTIVMTGQPAQEIQRSLAKLAKTDVPGRIKLARKAFEIREYELARSIAAQAQEIDPNSREAVDMIDLAGRQIAFEAKSRAATRATKGPRVVGGALDRSLAIPLSLVDEQDINAIKQSELQPADSDFVRVRFLNDVRKRFSAQPQRDRRNFARLSAFDQALTIIREGDAQMRKDVQIVGDPLAIRGYRAVQKQILAGCAATQCHGSLAGGNFVLYAVPESEPSTYTNFLLLQQYARENQDKPAGIFGGGSRTRMIDRDYPKKSLLLQYALPLSTAEIPHPKVPGFRQTFSSPDDGMYGKVYSWIRYDLPRQEPGYDIKYISPVQALSQPDAKPADPTSRPTTQPSNVH